MATNVQALTIELAKKKKKKADMEKVEKNTKKKQPIGGWYLPLHMSYSSDESDRQKFP